MQTKKFNFVAKDNKDIAAMKWFPDNEADIKAVIQLNHGMAEHKERYEYFASKLVEQGFIVYIHDHRGHGETARDESEIGYFCIENGWDKVVKTRCGNFQPLTSLDTIVAEK